MIGFPFAYWMAVKVAPKWRGILLALVIVPFWTNFLVRTIGWRYPAPRRDGLGDAERHGVADGPLAILDTRSPCSSVWSTTTCRS